MTKHEKNSAYHFGDRYLANHLVKYMQNCAKLYRVGALSLSTGFQFLRKIC